jgi:hypothetical protein
MLATTANPQGVEALDDCGSIDVPVGVAANLTVVRVVACCLTECNASTCGDVDVD